MNFPNTCIEKYYRLYQDLLNFSGLSWWLIDLSEDSDTFYCNQSMCEMFSLEKLLTHHCVEKTFPIAGDYNKNIALKDAKKSQQIFDEYHSLKNGDIEEFHNRFPYYDAKLDEVFYFTSMARAILRDDSGKAIILFGIIEYERISTTLFKLSKLDCLTGLNNRREFDSHLDFIINLARREQQKVTLIMCDIDCFKLYNDFLGHYQGDQCLIKVAKCIAQTCHRSTDVVCRYGGEEFAIICYGELDDSAQLAEDVRQSVFDLNMSHPQASDAMVTLSVGFATIVPQTITTARELIEKADTALYKAKDSGRNLCVDFNYQVV
ncbi:diguanylate cyclase [Shewanella donghaensis]|uniref:diguanylate cyclase n=1 Tax=Shewanella donghaensis TaxID=238836 RepID=UPI001181DDDD|nr:diguanylate cyclase [Shewanella donghaensis]